MFYGAAQDNGGPFSDPNILTDGNIQWSVLNTPPAFDVSEYLNSSSVGVDQQGLGTVYQYWLPNSNGTDLTGGFDDTNFFQTNDIGTTFGLLQQSRACRLPTRSGRSNGIANFAVDPVNGSDIVISSSTGNIFATSNDGGTWFDIGTPAVFGSPGNYSLALAYGAPDPSAPDGIGNLGNFIYVGTSTGQIYATQIGGGTPRPTATPRITGSLVGSTTNGLDGSQIERSSPIRLAAAMRLTPSPKGSVFHRQLDPLGEQSHADMDQHHRQHQRICRTSSTVKPTTRRPTRTRSRTIRRSR